MGRVEGGGDFERECEAIQPANRTRQNRLFTKQVELQGVRNNCDGQSSPSGVKFSATIRTSHRILVGAGSLSVTVVNSLTLH